MNTYCSIPDFPVARPYLPTRHAGFEFPMFVRALDEVYFFPFRRDENAG